MKLKSITSLLAISAACIVLSLTTIGILNNSLLTSNEPSSVNVRANIKKNIRAPLVPPPYEVDSLPTFKLPENAPCEDVVTNDWAFPAYKVTLEALSSGTLPNDVPFLACFLPGWEMSTDAKAARRAFVSEAFFPQVLYGYLKQGFESSLASSIETGTTLQWPIGNYGEAALIAYQRTEDTAFIDLYISFFDRLMLLRDSQLDYHDDWHKKIMDSWGSYNLARQKRGHGESWISHVTLFAVVMAPATGFAREIKANPDLSEYHEWADGVVAFFDQAYPQFDVDLRPVEDTGEQWYWRPVVEKFEALNHIHRLGEALLNMYAITGNSLYEERIRAILRVFEKTMIINDDGLASWNYSPYFQVESAKKEKNSKVYSEPTWKGSITVPFLYLAAQDGFAMSDGVLDAVTRSITDHILADAIPKLHTHPKESRAVTKQDLNEIVQLRVKPGPGSVKQKKMPSDLVEIMKLDNNFAGFYYAETVAPEVSQLMRDYVANNPEVFPMAWFTNSSSVSAYSMSLSDGPTKGSP